MYSTKFDTNNHSVFKIYFHLILVTKYRQKVITEEIFTRLKEIFERIGKSYNITIVEINYEKDHVHILLNSHPKTNMTKFINAYKSSSSRLIKKEYPKITNKLWKETFWSKGFCLVSSGGITIDKLKDYVKNQKEM